MSIIKPTDDIPVSKKNVKIEGEPALVIHREQLQLPAELEAKKKKMQEEIDRRKKVAEENEEYQELFQTVVGLIGNKEFWELVPDASLQYTYAFIMGEMKKRGVSTPKLEK